MKRRFAVNKLVRDKLPEIIFHEIGADLSYRETSGAERQNLLKQKLIEEGHEVIGAQTREELLDELADVLEVLFGIADSFSISNAELEATRAARKNERGGFQKGILCHYIEVSKENPIRLQYYLDRPKQYPEIKVEEC